MSFKKAEKKETNTYVIEFQIEKADFDAANDRAFHKNAKNISIPGFRKGKAPRHLIEKMYGTGVFYEEAINDCLPAAYEEAAKASGLDIIGQPEFDITTIDENGVAMTAKVTNPIPVAIPRDMAKNRQQISLEVPGTERNLTRLKAPSTATPVPRLPLTIIMTI